MFIKTLFYRLKSLFRKPKSEQYYEYQLLTGEVLTIKKGEMFDTIINDRNIPKGEFHGRC